MIWTATTARPSVATEWFADTRDTAVTQLAMSGGYDVARISAELGSSIKSVHEIMKTPAEVDDGIWLVTFINYDLGYIDLEQKTLQTIDTPSGSCVSPMS